MEKQVVSPNKWLDNDHMSNFCSLPSRNKQQQDRNQHLLLISASTDVDANMLCIPTAEYFYTNQTFFCWFDILEFLTIHLSGWIKAENRHISVTKPFIGASLLKCLGLLPLSDFVLHFLVHQLRIKVLCSVWRQCDF